MKGLLTILAAGTLYASVAAITAPVPAGPFVLVSPECGAYHDWQRLHHATDQTSEAACPRQPWEADYAALPGPDSHQDHEDDLRREAEAEAGDDPYGDDLRWRQAMAEASDDGN